VDIGKKPSFLSFDEGSMIDFALSVFDISLPLILDMNPVAFSLPQLEHIIVETARKTDLIAIIDSAKWPICGNIGLDNDVQKYLPHIAFFLNPDADQPPENILRKTRLVEIPDSGSPLERANQLKGIFPEIIVCVRVDLNADGVRRAIRLAESGIESIHVVADFNGDEIGAEKPRFIRDMIREIHNSLVEGCRRDEVTLIAGGGIALPEHMAKAVICGADLVSTYLPLIIALECRVCGTCKPGGLCPARFEEIDFDYGVGRMRNLIAAWHLQLIEVMGAMGMRDARRLRGDIGRAMFFEELEEEVFGPIFGSRRNA
jgi:hypothetical protein